MSTEQEIKRITTKGSCSFKEEQSKDISSDGI
jgi:hypothetical protein